jgi:hypothetical protein
MGKVCDIEMFGNVFHNATLGDSRHIAMLGNVHHNESSGDV